MSEVGDRINAAIEVMDTEGWCKGRLHNDLGERCAVGAILVTTSRLHHSYFPAVDKVFEHLPEEFKTGHAHRGVKNVWDDSHISRVVGFNNHPDTTYEMLRGVFEKAALDEGVTL